MILDIASVVDDKQVLSLSGGGRVREYQLTKRVGFSLHDTDGPRLAAGGEIVDPAHLHVQRIRSARARGRRRRGC